MIVVSVGSSDQPFARLVSAVQALDPADVFLQHGPVQPPQGIAKAVPYLGFRDLFRAVEQADAVVTHAGVGSILMAAELGKTPIVMPRRKELGEAVDDHQYHLANALAAEGAVVAVSEAQELRGAIETLAPRPLARVMGNAGLVEAVRESLMCGCTRKSRNGKDMR